MSAFNFRRLASSTCIAIVGLGCSLSLGAEIRQEDAVSIAKEETVQDDVYAIGKSVTIDGIVEGDLIVFAKDVIINGEVRGDVIGAAQCIEVNGTLGDDARIAGQVLKIGPTAKIAGDLIAAGFSLECTPGSYIEGDALYGGFQGIFAGQIKKQLRMGGTNCQLGGEVGGDVVLAIDAGADTPTASQANQFSQSFPQYAPRLSFPDAPVGLSLTEGAKVDGKLTYYSDMAAHVDEKAKVAGGMEQLAPEQAPNQPAAAPVPPGPLDIIWFPLQHTASVAVVGLCVLLLLPQWSRSWSDNIRTRPLASIGGGILGVIAIGPVLLFVAIVLGLLFALAIVAHLFELVPVVVVGGTLLFFGLIFGFALFAGLLGQALVGMALGRVVLRSDNVIVRAFAMLLGLLPFALLLLIPNPWVAFILLLLVFLFGLGGYMIWLLGYEPLAAEARTQTAARTTTARPTATAAPKR